MSCGKQAAQKMDERLMGEDSRWEQLFPEFEYSRTAPGEPSLSRRHVATMCQRRSEFVRSRKWLPASIQKRRWKNAAAACAAICELTVSAN